MPNVDPSSRASSEKIDDVEGLSKELDRSYEKLATGINSKKDTLVRSRAPTTDDYQYETGTMWVATGTDKVYVLTSRVTLVTVTWSVLN